MWFRTLFDSLEAARPRTPVRPPPCRMSVEALDDRIVPAAAMLSVGDAAVAEGYGGTVAAVVVTLSAPSHKTVQVDYKTANGTALVWSDYQPASGTLTFAPGETTKTILVPVYGDGIAEPDETFSVDLSRARGARIADGQGAVTIVDDGNDGYYAGDGYDDTSGWLNYDASGYTDAYASFSTYY